jgi:hypothetical protein
MTSQHRAARRGALSTIGSIGVRRLRVLLGSLLLVFCLVIGVALIPPTVTYAADQAIAVDRQAYVPDAGPDAYQADALSQGGCSASQCPAPDPISIHVAAGASQMTYHSLLHLELTAGSIPAGATVSSLVVTLTVSNDPSKPQDNVNTGQAILDAYPLAAEMTASFTGCSASTGCTAPAVDTAGPKVVGKAASDSSGNIVSFSFDVARMLPYWQGHGGHTDFAVVPDVGAATQPYSIAFDRTLSGAVATVNAPPASLTTPNRSGTAPVIGGGTVGGGGGGSGASAPLTVPTAAPATASTPSPAHARPATGSVATGRSGGSSGIPIWLLVLGVSLVAAVALLAQPVSQALSASGGARLGLIRELKIHPRMFAVAATLMAWSTAFSVYAGATGAGTIGGSAGAPLAANGGAGQSLPSYAPDTSATPGPTVPGAAGAPGSSGGSGGRATIHGSPVGAAAFAGTSGPRPPEANLFTGADNTVGITDTTIQMCAHAALTFGPAFNIGAGDLNVYWNMVNDPSTDPYPHSVGQGGIYNRKIVQPGGADGISVQDDGYQPSKAVQAAQACQQQSGGNFFLLSGIGFDQIPAVRVWAEQNHVLYIHHIATQQGTAGLQYSFTMLPTLEQVGAQFGQYYLAHMRGKTIGIIKRQSSNWEPGITAFKAVLAAAGQGGNVKVEDPVTNNQGDYSKQIVDMETANGGAGVDTVLIWENALAADSIIQQAGNQNWVPPSGWLLYPFNLTLYTLNQSASNANEIKGMQGMVPWPAYTSSSARCASGGSGITRNNADYGQYQKEIQKFEAAYAKWDPSANLCGDGGDLLFGAWLAWEQVGDLLLKCGVDCNRDRVAGLMLNGYRAQVGANCAVDFSGGDHHHGGTGGEDLYAVKQQNGGPGWINTGYCQTTIR